MKPISQFHIIKLELGKESTNNEGFEMQRLQTKKKITRLATMA